MKETIDCLFIGHNQMNFPNYEKSVREMGTNSGAYRDLNLNFVWYYNKPYSIAEIFNIFYDTASPLSLGETFNGAIAYLGTYLDRRGLTFDFVNSFNDEKEQLADKLNRGNIRTIAIITTLYVSVFPILEIMDFIKKYNQTAKIIIGGPFIATQVRALDAVVREDSFKTIGADFYVNSSQGEAALVNLIKALKNQSPVERVNNIYYRAGDRYIGTSVLKEENPLKDNMVNWNLFSTRIKPYVNVRTAISCPFRCSFCGFPEHAGAYQTAGVEAIQQELDQLRKMKIITSIHFIDDTFNVPQKRFKDILRMMIKNKYFFKWHSHFRCQFADRETIELMKASGCEGVFLGIESGSAGILKNMNKSATLEKYFKGIQLLKEYGILTFGSFIIGFPGETADTVRETIEFIKTGGLDFYRTQLWYCDTLTPIWKQKETYDIKGSHFEWRHRTMDSKTACNIIEDIFLTIREPVWLTQYNFEFDSIFHLLHRGLNLEQVKQFLRNFNQGVTEKFSQEDRKEISYNVMKQLQYTIQGNPQPFKQDEFTGEKNNRDHGLIEAYDAAFDF